MKMLLFASSICMAASAYAGGIGGSNPPALEELELMFLASPNLSRAALFTTDGGDINLGVSGALSDSLVLSTAGSKLQSFRISDKDFDALSQPSHGLVIDAVSLGQGSGLNADPSRSYRVEDGDALGELILKDRRTLIRSSSSVR